MPVQLNDMLCRFPVRSPGSSRRSNEHPGIWKNRLYHLRNLTSMRFSPNTLYRLRKIILSKIIAKKSGA